MLPAEGLIEDAVYGYHTIWIAEVPFIPAVVDKTNGDFASESTNRLAQMMARQIRFLYGLAQSREHQATFELRLVAWPQPDRLAAVGIAFLGKAFDLDRDTSRGLALGLWEKFSAVFPREAPFSYPLVPVQHFENDQSQQIRSFKQWFEPFPFQQLTTPCTMTELRKHEDWPTIRDVGGVLHARDYIPHPFVPALDYSAMARLFETMAHQSQVCMVTITLRPQHLTDQEVIILHELADWYQRTAGGEISINNRLLEVLRNKLKSDIIESYLRPRAELGMKVYESLRREHRSLFLMRLQVTGNPIAADDVIEALGSEVMANAGNTYPSRWTRIEATAEELRWARFNLQWLEFERWGISPMIQQDRRIIRLRSLATVQEAVGAFRLPVAPGNGGIAGIEVRDEPFLLPGAIMQHHQVDIPLGTLLDRGIPTGIPYSLPLNALAGITQVFGDQNDSRQNIVRHLLNELRASGIPWRLICKADSTGVALAQELHARHVLVDTLAGQNGDAVLIHPFVPPPGVSLARFIDMLLRMLITVYGLDSTISLLLRQALRETYQQAGWTEQRPGRPVTPEVIADQIDATARQANIPADLAASLQVGCVLPLRDLAMTATSLFERYPVPTIPCDDPMIVEVGWLGSDTSSALVQGCLWSWFTLALTATTIPKQQLHGIVGVEGAHSIFGLLDQHRSSPAPLVSLVHECVASGVATLLIDDRPDLIEPDIASKASTTIITTTTHASALESGAALITASPRQQKRMNHLAEREAVVTVRGSVPALILL